MHQVCLCKANKALGKRPPLLRAQDSNSLASLTHPQSTSHRLSSQWAPLKLYVYTVLSTRLKLA
jgi:hypothetical protein